MCAWHGLDVTGRPPLEDDMSIAMERVRVKKAELYWDKIPEQVRPGSGQGRQAQLAGGAQSTSNTTCRNDASGSGQEKRTQAF